MGRMLRLTNFILLLAISLHVSTRSIDAAIFICDLSGGTHHHLSKPSEVAPIIFNEDEIFSLNTPYKENLAPADHGIRENVPSELRQKYDRWKKDLLATEYGRSVWGRYENDKTFLLRIVVTRERKYGAGTDDYKWDKDGKLVGATIYLGRDLDRGFPDPIYYPVMNSLRPSQNVPGGYGNVLASAKLAHELGHVNHTAKMDAKKFQQEGKLIEQYYSIFLKNGHNAADPELLKIVEELGARPIEIWEDREYWSEVASLEYLIERLGSGGNYCGVFQQVRQNIEKFPDHYRQRFQILSDEPVASNCL